MAQILNHDLKGLLDRMARFKEEMLKSVSSGSSELNAFDMERLKSYLAATSAYIDWVQGQPALDLPESHPKEYSVADAPVQIAVESEIVNDLGRLFDVAYDELLHSQSSKKAASLISFDEARIRALLAKTTSYLDAYVAPQTPLDLPESSPLVGAPTAGRRG